MNLIFLMDRQDFVKISILLSFKNNEFKMTEENKFKIKRMGAI